MHLPRMLRVRCTESPHGTNRLIARRPMLPTFNEEIAKKMVVWSCAASLFNSKLIKHQNELHLCRLYGGYRTRVCLLDNSVLHKRQQHITINHPGRVQQCIRCFDVVAPAQENKYGIRYLNVYYMRAPKLSSFINM